MVADNLVRTTLSSHLKEKYTLQEGSAPDPSQGIESISSEILTMAPEVVIMDYCSEDALSVKILQEVIDRNERIGFVFVDSSGQADRENIMMAVNEGAQAFIPVNISKVALQNYVNRAISGPLRLRTQEDVHEASEQRLEGVSQRLTIASTRLKNSEKLIAYLLSTPLGSQPRKVLILSDSPYQRELLKKHLEDSNFVVLTASAIGEAVSLTLSEKPRIIISDYELDDGKTGIDFCKEIKFVNKYTPCYFVVCTAGEDKIPAVMTPGNGVDDCLLKPASQSALNEFLARVALGLIV